MKSILRTQLSNQLCIRFTNLKNLLHIRVLLVIPQGLLISEYSHSNKVHILQELLEDDYNRINDDKM